MKRSGMNVRLTDLLDPMVDSARLLLTRRGRILEMDQSEPGGVELRLCATSRTPEARNATAR